MLNWRGAFDLIFPPAKTHFSHGYFFAQLPGLRYSTSTNRWIRSHVAKKSVSQPLYPNTR